MAKQARRVVKARKSESASEDDSLLVRSAESLGRVIGSLQRQVRSGSKRASSMTDDALDALPDLPRFDGLFGTTGRKPANGRNGRKSTRKAGGARKSARKTAGARKNAGSRKRSARAAAKKR